MNAPTKFLKGVMQANADPISRVQGIGYAVIHLDETVGVIGAEIARKLESGSEGQGEVLGDAVLIYLLVRTVPAAPAEQEVAATEEAAAATRLAEEGAVTADPAAPAAEVAAPDAMGAANPLVPGGGLAAHEAAGGHTIALHVGQTDAQLAARLAAEPRIPAASTFADRAIAEQAVAEALDARAADVEAWLAGRANRLNPPLRGNLGYDVGTSLPRGAASSTTVQSVLIVLQRDASMPTGYRIVTAYPVP